EPQARFKIFCTPKTSCSPAATRKSTAAWKTPPSRMFAKADIETRDLEAYQTLKFAVLIHSQKFAPGGFCRSAEYIVSNVDRVTKSYLFLWVEKPCTKVWSAILSLRQPPLPP